MQIEGEEKLQRLLPFVCEVSGQLANEDTMSGLDNITLNRKDK